MKKYDLTKNWILKNLHTNATYPGTVPGSVYWDLMENKAMADPYYRDNESSALSLMENDYSYETTFTVPEEFDDCDEILLHFDGIDTIAEVYFNDHLLGTPCNMHRVWEYPIKPILSEKNTLRVILHSPTKKIAENFETDPVQGTADAMKGFPSLRKAHCMFGWDWGPRLPDAGIWRPVYLLGITTARIRDFSITQNHHPSKDGNVEVSLDFHLTPSTSDLRLRGEISLFGPDNSLIGTVDAKDTIKVQNPMLWWPNGLGDQPLYTVEARLYCDDLLLDSVTKRIGLRTMTVIREKDAYGECFCHQVNGVRIFAMGADYIPQDNILRRICKDRTRTLLEQCVAANFNCIRVWGGGYYPEDDFYDLCDELGLIVWQDFMFACANYRLTESFEENIKPEIRENVRRIRHHASLGLWCGNNEMEKFAKIGEWGCDDALRADYIKMYEYIIPNILKEEDPNTYYWPASPSSGGSFDDPDDPTRGDVHYWDVWHGNKPFTEYRKFFFRYLSEFGFQSFPSMKTIETFTLPEDRNVFSYVMEKHQRNADANGKIMNYMQQMFLYPTDFDTFIYASQLLQAEAIRYGVEHFRRHRGQCMGTVYWQLNDCWPVASWSSIDYYGRWKALHYYAKRFFAPLQISCEEEGLLTQSMNVNAEPFEVEKSIRLNVANETLFPHEVTVSWALCDAKGNLRKESSTAITVPALSSTWLDKVSLLEADLYNDYVHYSLSENGEIISQGTVIFSQPKHFHFEDPKLTVKKEGTELIITSEAYAKSVEISNENDDLILSDNFFDMGKGTRKIQVLQGDLSTLRLRSVYDIR